MSRVIVNEKTANVLIAKDGSELVLTNEATGQQLRIPKTASPAELRAAKAQLRPKVESVYDAPAKSVVAAMYGTEVKTTDDPEPYVPVGANRNSPYVLRAEKLHAEWSERQRQKRERETALRDRKALADDIVDGLKVKPAEPSAPTVDDGSQYLPTALRGSFDDFKREALGGGDARLE